MPERHKFALMADANLKFASPRRVKRSGMEIRMNEMTKLCWYWLAKLEVLGAAGRARLLQRFKTVEKLYGLTEKQVAAVEWLREDQSAALLDTEIKCQAEKEFHKLSQKGIQFIIREEEDFPESLLQIPNAPDFLFYKGSLPREDALSVAVIGARACSACGRRQAEQFSRELAAAGVQIISGMARGIDGYSQQAALEYGSSYAVLGCGVDYCYPPENFRLYEELLEKGGVLSEFPPGSKPLAYHFPMRNRLIAGLSDGLLVIEARKKSGTLITVDCALEQNKPVFAIPGREDEQLNAGCNELLQDGACAVRNAMELLHALAGECFGIMESQKMKNMKKNIFLLEEAEKIVYANVSLEPKHLEELLSLTGWAPEKMMQILVSLELKGMIYSPAGNYYMAK